MFSPPIESRNMRFGMLKEHADLIGKTKAFDGATLFLPHRLPKPVNSHSSFRNNLINFLLY